MEHTEEKDCAGVGKNIRKFRIQQGISQIELAKAIGVSQTHMSNIENGNSGISLWTAVKISRVLGCSIDQMVDGNKDTSDNKHEKKMMIDIETLADALKLIAIQNKIKGSD